MDIRKVLLFFALKYDGDVQEIYNAITRKEKIEENIDNIEEKIHCSYMTIMDADYPLRLRAIMQPPIVLFYYGDKELLNSLNNVAVIGTRKNSPYGYEMANKIVKGLKKYDSVIISGLASGIDGISHECALNNDMKTIAVLGGGIENCYPPGNQELYDKIKEKGLILSEYPLNAQPKPMNFLIRNRIIAALSDKIVVVEANLRSGTMNTVRYGLEYGKDIYCVPNLANVMSGCNYLIKDGAKLVENAKDIMED